MAELKQIERLLRIIQIVSSGSKITTTALLKRFEGDVSIRTLQRDLHHIAQAGIPLKSSKSLANENEWYLDSNFRSFIPQTLGLNEYLAAHMLKENLKVFRNTEFSHEIETLLQKIEQIVPDDVFIEVDDSQADEMYENYTAGLFDYSSYSTIINTIITAIIQKKKSFVNYFNVYSNEIKSFYVEPRRLIYFKGGLYVIVYIRRFEKFRLLAIQRIKTFKQMDESYPDEPHFNPELFWKNKFGLFGSEPKDIILKFNSSIRMHIEGRHWHSSQSVTIEEDGSLLLNLTVGISPELIAWIFSWHENIEVIGPNELRTLIKEKLNNLQNIYPTT